MKWRINGSEIIEATSLAEAVYIASAMVEVEPLTSIERIPDEPVLANFNPNMHYDRYCLPGKAKRFDVCVTTRYCGEYRDGWRWVCEIQGCDGVKRHQYLYVGTNQETPDRDPIKPPINSDDVIKIVMDDLSRHGPLYGAIKHLHKHRQHDTGIR